MFRWLGLSMLVLILSACGEGGSDSSSGGGRPSVPQPPDRSTVDLSEPSVDPEGCFTTTPCLDETDCQAGTRCNTAGSPPRCAELFCGGSGALCSSDDFCGDGLTCNPGYAPQECRAGVSGDICLYHADGEGSGGPGAPCAEGFLCIDVQHPPRCIDESLLDPEQEILIDGQVAQGEPVEVELQYMPQSAQWVSVEVQNVGWVPLTIKAIDWSPDANPHVSLDTDVGASCASGTELEPDESCSLVVTYAWPGGQTFDGSPSTLQIMTDAMGGTGTSTSIVFTPIQPAPAPRVDTPNYLFETATPSKPAEHTFIIHNDSSINGGPFQVTGIALEQPSDTFVLKDLPILPAAVEQGAMCGDLDQPGCSVKFTVEYTPNPGDQADSNAVMISTDATPEPLKVPLSANVVIGGYEVSFSHVMELDFSSSSGAETRSVTLLSTGPGVLKVKEPYIEPWEATPVFSWQAFIDSATPTPVFSWPRALVAGKSLTYDVTYQAPGDGSEPPNATLLIPVETPDNETIELDLVAATP